MAEATAGSGAPAGAPQRTDPYRNYNFALEIDGKSEGYFTYFGGLCIQVPPIQYREGGDARTIHYLAGPLEHGQITLKYGLTDSRVLWDWMMTAASGMPQRKNISLIMQGPDGVGERLRWNLFDSWPCEWRGSPLDALGKEFAVESLTLVCERIERA